MNEPGMQKEYDVAIIGAGITGTALLYVLSNYTDIGRIALIEKYPGIAEVNSHHNNNSQTLHFGDIETNYSLDKARNVKEAAGMLVRYLEQHAAGSYVKGNKMVLAVGEKEIEELNRRFEEFRRLFPNLKKIGRDAIAKLEPRVVEGREEKIGALFTEGYAVNYKKLAESFVQNARKSKKSIDVMLAAEAKIIQKHENSFRIATAAGSLTAKVVAVMAGPHSLLFAHALGYGNDLGILPVAGSFYCATAALNGKVYTVQIKKLPFAAVHGDPDVNDPKETRFGPTAKVLPMLERHNYKTVFDFIKTSVWSLRGVASLLNIISDKTIFLYVLKNLLYDLPVVGKRMFLASARKIVPKLRLDELRYGKGIGGIRPQVVNTRTKKLEMGEAEIVGENILFNITPSPGASVCLKNAEQDTLKIISFFQGLFQFEEKRWCRDFGSTLIECRE